jgi:hypothetical protein
VGVQTVATGTLGVAVADALVSIEGGDLSEKESDLGHRLLPAGEHLGIADRAVERKERQRQGERGDRVLAGLAGLQGGEVALSGDAGFSGRGTGQILRGASHDCLRSWPITHYPICQ